MHAHRRRTERARRRLEDLGGKLLAVSSLVPLSYLSASDWTAESKNESQSASQHKSNDESTVPQQTTINDSSLAEREHQTPLINEKTLLQKCPPGSIAKSRVKEVASVLKAFIRIYERRRSISADQNRYLRYELDGLAQLLQVGSSFRLNVHLAWRPGVLA